MKNTRMITIFLHRKMFSNLNQIKTLKVDVISYFKSDVKTNYFLDKIQIVRRHIGFSHTQKLYHHQSKKLESDLK